MKISKKRFVIASIAIFFAGMVVILSYHAVDNSLTKEDIQYIPKYLTAVEPLPKNYTYLDELNFIISIQRSVLNIAPGNDSLPYGQKRELKELYEARTGLCFDRSRVIEKLLRYGGFETRHVSIYSTEKTDSVIISLITPGVKSHAVTEVLTKDGWLVVDSNNPWVSMDADQRPISIHAMQLSIKTSAPIKWHKVPPAAIYTKPFIFIYGLYSRHGQFYPPFDFIPDINWGEFVQNLL